MVHRVPKCKIDTAWKVLVTMLWRDKCSANVNNILDFSFRVLWVLFYMQVKALGIVPQEPRIFVCMCGRCIFCVPACMTAYMWASTRRSQRSTLGTAQQELSIFVFLRQGLSLGLTRSRWLGEAGCPASPRGPACSLPMLELQACSTLTSFFFYVNV